MIEKYKVRYYNQFIEKYEPQEPVRPQINRNNATNNAPDMQEAPSNIQTFSVVLNLVIMFTSLIGFVYKAQYNQSLTFSAINFTISLIKQYGVFLIF